jgi:UV DNA damage endonuclease
MEQLPTVNVCTPRIRLGYACINTQLREGRPNVFMSRTMRMGPAVTFERIRDLVRANVADIMTILRWNDARGIRMMRLSSDIFPHITNELIGRDVSPDGGCTVSGSAVTPSRPKSTAAELRIRATAADLRARATARAAALDRAARAAGYPERPMYDISFVAGELREIGRYASATACRLSLHALPYVQLASPNPRVASKSRADLAASALLLDLMGLDLDSVIVVHIGGVYGSKQDTLERFTQAFRTLPDATRRRIVVENDDYQYSSDMTLAVAKRVGAPHVFDFLHYRCNPGTLTLEQSIAASLRTWGARRPKFHLSGQAPGARIGSHSAYIGSLPDALLQLSRAVAFDVMIEAGAKERAVERLHKRHFARGICGGHVVWTPKLGGPVEN